MPTDGQNSSQGDGQVYADATDYYELLQISPNADPDTVTRVFRLLARRYHPDQPDTGNEEKFREILAAYAVLSDPEKRAHYDVNHMAIRRERWRFVAEGRPPQATTWPSIRCASSCWKSSTRAGGPNRTSPVCRCSILPS